MTVNNHLSSLFRNGLVSTAWVDRLVMSRDASLYRIVPSEVVRPGSVDDITRLLKFCTENNRHITFRAGGTSLSGQAIGNDILVNIARGWDSIAIHDSGATISLGPGVTGGRANASLHRYGKKLGPDPASIDAAMIGGIIANNSSGMCCGTTDNSYNTIVALDFILANGTRVDTADPTADEKFRSSNPDLYNEILQLRDSVRLNTALSSRIRNKFSIKNTMGYSINAFLDEDLPTKIIAKLMIGSEGTLGFIVNATFRTIANAMDRWTLLEAFPSLDHACEAALQWTNDGAAAVELMDDSSLQSFASLQTTPEAYRWTTPGMSALLVEYHHDSPPVDRAWITDIGRQAEVWRLRKGLMPTIGASRTSGETMINEDVAVSPKRLAALIDDIKKTFAKHDYQRAIIFGHAKDGNIHFVVNQRFDSPDSIERYGRFMHDVADCVLGKHDGSLKAEHGTGRNMAPFLEQEWGTDAVNLMRRVKALLDPQNILNPGVLLNANPRVHLENIKEVPTIDFEVDRCIECGFCEHVCPTRDVTLTPRQRIILRREIALNSNAQIANELTKAETTRSIDSCVVDGYCALACPVGIDTGSMVKRLRAERTPTLLHNTAVFGANHYGLLSKAIGTGVGLLIKSPEQSQFSTSSEQQIHDHPSVGYLPSCPVRWTEHSQSSVQTIANQAGINLVTPSNYDDLCCGQPFESKGLTHARTHVVGRLSNELGEIRSECNSVLVTDTNTCAGSLLHELAASGWTILSAAHWLHDMVLPRVSHRPVPMSVAVHPGCGSAKLAEADLVLDVVKRLVTDAYIPSESTCCGMGGIHGLRYPEIPRSAIAPMKKTLSDNRVEYIITGNAFCAHGLTKHTSIPALTLVQFAARLLTAERSAPSI